MLSGPRVAEWCVEGGISFATGVPDSVLGGFCRAVSSGHYGMRHTVAVNEGAAVAIAIGWHLSTRSIPLVYLQNSGLGNAVNPLASLASSEVFSIPLLLLIGWRGTPGQADEAQHRLMGAATESILRSLEIPFAILPHTEEEGREAVLSALDQIRSTGRSRALLVARGTISDGDKSRAMGESRKWCGAEALVDLCRRIPVNDICVSTVGFISRTLAEHRRTANRALTNDLFVVGGMGLASQVALGIALGAVKRRVWCLDGDGALLMHLGAAAAIGASGAKNLIHVLFNNGIHESVGGLATSQPATEFPAVSLACGYRAAASVSTAAELDLLTPWIHNQDGPYFLQLCVASNPGLKVPRPATSPSENKVLLMDTLSKGESVGRDGSRAG
jgi:phosphonopyruvate decarboxylase